MTAASPSSDVEQIRSVVIRVSHFIDRRAWADLRALYAAEVETDYTSLFGGTPQVQPADVLIQGWRLALGRVSTQHLLGPIDVQLSRGTAVAECHVRAWHHAPGTAGGDEWVVAGHYLFTLRREDEGWKITTMKLETLQQSGNLALLQEV